ncbi:hypothetical protein DY000_02032178 [Brassica cretica]|uniref:RNase H type-1 domain-containing protein n=1 Tax=Brassica cretica TaxID=69181 RepID=A0ABQ7DS61_BRACR|nr:hypothetical protein DY000_02032178 [Brassica cretica]
MAQMVETTFSAEERSPAIAHETEDANGTSLWRCQVNASWSEISDGIVMGFVLYEQEVEVQRGSRKGPQTESPLHAEVESLVWAMKEVSDRQVTCVKIELDCQQLIKIIQQKKHWPSLDSELDEIEALKNTFNVVSFKFISRSANVCAGGLAKEARSRMKSFSLVEVKDPLRLALEAGLYETF